MPEPKYVVRYHILPEIVCDAINSDDMAPTSADEPPPATLADKDSTPPAAPAALPRGPGPRSGRHA